MSYLLDTNACIAVINGRPVAVRERLRRTLVNGESILVSTVSVFELWYGVGKSARAEANAERLAVFLGGLEILSFEAEDARVAGTLRADLERSGKPIGAYDYLIAGQAVRHGLVLVTANVREFDRINGLNWENWAARGSGPRVTER